MLWADHVTTDHLPCPHNPKSPRHLDPFVPDCTVKKKNDVPFVDLHDFRLHPSMVSMPNGIFVEHYCTAGTALAFRTHENEKNVCVTVKHALQGGSHLLCGVYTLSIRFEILQFTS